MATLEEDLGAQPAAETSGLEADLGPAPVQSKPQSDWDKMSLLEKNMAVAKAGPRWLLQGLGKAADTIGGLLETGFSEGMDEDAGKPILEHAGTAVANAANLPQAPQSTAANIIGAGVKAAPSAILGGPEAFVPSLVPTMASGASSQAAAEAGYGPTGQFIAGLTPFAPAGAAALTRGLVRGGSQGAANMAERANIAANAGITPSVGQVSGNPIIRSAETVGAHVPGGSALAETRGAGLNQQVEKRVSDIVKDLAPDMPQNAPTATQAGEAIQEGLKNRVKGLRQETKDVSESMMEAMGGKDKPTSAPKLEQAAKDVTSSTGDPDIDRLITGAKTKAVANTVQKVSEQPKVPISYSTDGEGYHSFKSPNGESHARELANGDIQIYRSDTSPEAQGKGEGTARLATAAQVATAKGARLISDISLSPNQAKAFEGLSRRGWKVDKNPNAEVNPDTGNLISDSPKNPIYTVTAPKTQTTPGTSVPVGSSEQKFEGQWTYDPATGKTEPVTSEVPKTQSGDLQKAVLNEPTPWTVGGLKDLRTRLGKAIGSTRDDVLKRQLQTMYGAASDDLRAHAQSMGAESSWDLFNNVASNNAATQKNLVKAMKEAGGPEAAFTSAMNGSKAGASKIAPIMNNLDEEGKNLFRATVLHRLGRAGGAVDRPFDANTYMNNWKNMSPEAKNVLFGTGANAGPPTQLRKNLDALSDALDMFANKGDIKPGLVRNIQQGTGPLHKVGLFGVLALMAEGGAKTAEHIATGHPYLAAGAGLGAAGMMAGNPIMSRVLTNPKTVAWLTQSTKAPAGMYPVLLNQLHQMGTKDPDAKALADFIEQQGGKGGGGGQSLPQQLQTNQPQGTGQSESQIVNNHKMVRMKGSEGAPYMGVDPDTLTPNNPHENPASRPADIVRPEDYLPAVSPSNLLRGIR